MLPWAPRWAGTELAAFILVYESIFLSRNFMVWMQVLTCTHRLTSLESQQGKAFKSENWYEVVKPHITHNIALSWLEKEKKKTHTLSSSHLSSMTSVVSSCPFISSPVHPLKQLLHGWACPESSYDQEHYSLECHQMLLWIQCWYCVAQLFLRLAAQGGDNNTLQCPPQKICQ